MIYVSFGAGITDTLKSLNAIDGFCKFIGIEHVINLSDMDVSFFKTEKDSIELSNMLVADRIRRVNIKKEDVRPVNLGKIAINNNFDIDIIKEKLLSILKDKKAIKIVKKSKNFNGLYPSHPTVYQKMGVPFLYKNNIVKPLNKTKHYDIVVNFRVAELAFISYNEKLYGCRVKTKDIHFDMLDEFDDCYRNFLPVKAYENDLKQIKEKYKDKRILILTDGYSTMPIGLPEGNDFDLKEYENDQFQYIKDLGFEIKISDLSANDVYDSIRHIANADIVYYSMPSFPVKVNSIYRSNSKMVSMREGKTQKQFKHLY